MQASNLRYVWILAGLIASTAEAKTFDFRANPADARYSVAICARPSPDTARGVPAHAFMVWRESANDAERVSRAVGYAPGDELRDFVDPPKTLGPNSSQLSQEAYGLATAPCLELLVSKREFEATANAAGRRATSAKSEPDTNHVLSLRQEEAAVLIAEIAVRFSDRGLYVPKRRPGEPPLAFVRRLIDSNAAR